MNVSESSPVIQSSPRIRIHSSGATLFCPALSSRQACSVLRTRRMHPGSGDRIRVDAPDRPSKPPFRVKRIIKVIAVLIAGSAPLGGFFAAKGEGFAFGTLIILGSVLLSYLFSGAAGSLGARPPNVATATAGIWFTTVMALGFFQSTYDSSRKSNLVESAVVGVPSALLIGALGFNAAKISRRRTTGVLHRQETTSSTEQR
jgi:peptidoglycan/LPS O-acetylase OafA/YrhL